MGKSVNVYMFGIVALVILILSADFVCYLTSGSSVSVLIVILAYVGLGTYLFYLACRSFLPADFTESGTKTFSVENAREEESLPDLWEMTLPFLYDAQYVESLIVFLRERGVGSVLDCACGTGFPSIQLKRAGFDVYCSDGSEEMIRRFRVNMKKTGLDIPNRVLRWHDLHKLEKRFDAVLCRGNSLIYLDSWLSNEPSATNFLSNAPVALRQMRGVLNARGFLYVDSISADEYQRGPSLVEEFGERIVNDLPMRLTWTVKHDWKQMNRIVRSARRIGEITFCHDYRGFLLKHEELQNMLSAAGFSRVRKIKLDGERAYDVYIAS